METKKIDSLFHGTKSINSLISIIENGFYPSYANEFLGGNNYKIVMVSFSNIPLIEARNQVNYGDYFIGLKRSWGLKNNLQPVAYTYNNSKLENDVINLAQESAVGKAVMIFKKAFKENMILDINGANEKLISKELMEIEVNNETIEKLEGVFENFSNRIGNLKLYLKHYVVNDNNNNQRFAFNDREWRYIPEEVEKKIINEKNLKKPNKDFIEFEKKKKPHFRTNTLSFELEDISFIIVKEQSEVKKIFNVLEKRYTTKRILSNITNGSLVILSMDNIWNDL